MGALDAQLIRVSGAGIRREHGELRPAPPGPLKANYRVVEKWMTPLEAFRAVSAACVQHLEGNRYGALAGADPEYLHQMRVALRRQRTALGVFSEGLAEPVAAELGEELRWLSRAMGEARNWDVFMSGTLRPALSLQPRHAGLRAVRAACDELSAAARNTACRALESQRYFWIMRTLRALSYGDAQRSPAMDRATRPTPMRRHAAAVVTDLYVRAMRRGRRLMRLDARRLHRLRINVRRLRYGLLFLASLLPQARVRVLAESVEALQETLGAINDCTVAKELIGRAREHSRGPQRRKARKLLARRVKAARSMHREHLKAQWEDFRAAGRGWIYEEDG
jgi:CHAD domain-containing protein